MDSTTQESANNKDYEELEKVLQKYESEIRNHIRVIFIQNDFIF